MAASRIRRAVIAAALLAVVPAAPVAAAPAPGGSDAAVVTGFEGTRAALVRIEVTAVTTIVHLDHSTGDLHVVSGEYVIRQGQATGVITAGEGVVATLWRELAVDVDRVVVPAANRLFVEHLGATLEAGADATGRTRALHPVHDMHLQDCYVQRIDHCFTVPQMQYDVVLLTQPPRRVRALPINDPAGPTDVALLRIGGSAMPTAVLSDGDDVPVTPELLGYDTDVPAGPESSSWRPAAVPVSWDGAAASAPAETDLAGLLDRGLSGGPLVDPATGRVVALVDRDRASGQVATVGADAVRAALDAAGVPVERSSFDVAFATGLALLNDGDAVAATRQLGLAGEYFDSALAVEHAARAEEQARSQPASEPRAAAGAGGAGWPWFVALAAGLVLAAGLLWFWLRRRARGEPPTEDRPPDPALPGGVPPAGGPPVQPRGPVGPELLEVGARTAAGTRVVPAPAGPAASMPSGKASVPPGDVVPAPGARPPRAAGPAERDAFCIHCGHAHAPGGRFCGRCGTPVRA